MQPRSTEPAPRPFRGNRQKIGLVFDLDGTLVDTRDGIAQTLGGVLADHGFSAPAFSEVYPFIGVPLDLIFLHFLKKEGVESPGDSLMTDLLKEYRQIYARNVIPKTKRFPGVAETLNHLSRQGYPLAIATGKLVSVAKATLLAADLLDFFTLVLGSDSTPRPKPEPDLALLAVDGLGVPSDRAVMIGDSELDLLMGRSAGMITVGVTYGASTVEALRGAEPDYLIDAFSDLSDIIESIGQRGGMNQPN